MQKKISPRNGPLHSLAVKVGGSRDAQILKSYKLLCGHCTNYYTVSVIQLTTLRIVSFGQRPYLRFSKKLKSKVTLINKLQSLDQAHIE